MSGATSFAAGHNLRGPTRSLFHPIQPHQHRHRRSPRPNLLQSLQLRRPRSRCRRRRHRPIHITPVYNPLNPSTKIPRTTAASPVRIRKTAAVLSSIVVDVKFSLPVVARRRTSLGSFSLRMWSGLTTALLFRMGLWADDLRGGCCIVVLLERGW